MTDSTSTGGKCTIYTANNPPPPWSETDDCKTLEWAISLLQHPNTEVGTLATCIVTLYNKSYQEGSTIARCSYAQGIAESVNAILIIMGRESKLL